MVWALFLARFLVWEGADKVVVTICTLGWVSGGSPVAGGEQPRRRSEAHDMRRPRASGARLRGARERAGVQEELLGRGTVSIAHRRWRIGGEEGAQRRHQWWRGLGFCGGTTQNYWVRVH